MTIDTDDLTQAYYYAHYTHWESAIDSDQAQTLIYAQQPGGSRQLVAKVPAADAIGMQHQQAIADATACQAYGLATRIHTAGHLDIVATVPQLVGRGLTMPGTMPDLERLDSRLAVAVGLHARQALAVYLALQLNAGLDVRAWLAVGYSAWVAWQGKIAAEVARLHGQAID